jgi:diadenylate cyclase
MFGFDIGFLPVRIVDIVDILVVGYLMYRVYKLLRGSIAFNIFIGMLLLYMIWWLVRELKMEMLSMILGQFVSVGMIIVAIVFQPEIRRFLLFLGNSTLRGRKFWNNLIGDWDERKNKEKEIEELLQAFHQLSETKTGALILVSSNTLFSQPILNSGVLLDAAISKSLLLSIFNKESPMHDGAVVINNFRIKAASCVLPLSEAQDLPQTAGLRHRSALGVSELDNVVAFVVSEETGKVSVAHNGKISFDIDEVALEGWLRKYF